jgi:hypothetical protein
MPKASDYLGAKREWRTSRLGLDAVVEDCRELSIATIVWTARGGDYQVKLGK